MAKLQKYLFDLDFGAPPPRPVAELPADAFDGGPEEVEDELPPPPPTFTEEELILTRDQALEAGRQAGLREAEQASERLLGHSLHALGEQLRNLSSVQAQANDDMMCDAVDVALTVIRKLQPEMARDGALEEIAGVIRECLAHIEKDVRVTVRVNPVHIDSIRHFANQAAEATGFEGKLVYAADPRIQSGDCRVEWGDGGAERDVGRLWQEIDAVVARTFGHAAKPGEARPVDEADAGEGP